MFQEQAFTLAPEKVKGLTATNMWQVHADKTYDVRWTIPDAVEFIVVRTDSGRGKLWFADGTKTIVDPATVIVFRKSQIRHYRCENTKWNFWWIEFTMDKRDLTFPLQRALRIPMFTDENTHLSECFNMLRKNHPLSCRIASSRLALLLSEYLYRNKLAEEIHKPNRLSRIEDAIELMHKNLNGVSQGELARTACLSERRFRTLFEEVTGKAPKKFYDTLRLDSMKSRLQTGEEKLESLAQRYGFSSAAHLSKAFKKQFGMSPSEYVEGLTVRVKR
jgi:AraC-like DNA-binding protein